MSKDIFLGVGGSASSRIFGHYLFNRSGWSSTATVNPQRQAVLIMSGVDSGGSTGMQNDLFSLEDGLVNQALHQTANFPFQSYGDLKQFLIQALNFRQPEINWHFFLDFRSQELAPQLAVFTEFSELKRLPPAITKEFSRYLETFFFYYQKYYTQLPPDRRKPACLGNLWLSFLHSYCQDINQLNDCLRQLEFIPEWIEFIFLSPKRTHLVGLDMENQPVNGEHQFDEWSKPIRPESHRIVNVDSTELELNPILLQNLKGLTLEDRILISPGSDANWLGIVNQPTILELLNNKTIFWLSNLFRFASESPLPETVKHILSLGLKVELFLPELGFAKTLLAPENHYKLASYVTKEHKIPHLIYLQTYAATVHTQLEQWLSNPSLNSLGNQLQLEINKYGYTNLDILPIQTHYTAKIENVYTSYYHDPVYASQWLLSYYYA